LIVIGVSAYYINYYKNRDDKKHTIYGVVLGLGLLAVCVSSAMRKKDNIGWSDLINPGSYYSNTKDSTSDFKIREINLGPFHYKRS